MGDVNTTQQSWAVTQSIADSFNTTTSNVKTVNKTKSRDSHDVITKNKFLTYSTGGAAPTVPTEAMTAAVTGSTPQAVLSAGGGGVAGERTKLFWGLAALAGVLLFAWLWFKRK